MPGVLRLAGAVLDRARAGRRGWAWLAAGAWLTLFVAPASAQAFPAPDRPVAHIVSAAWSDEPTRDRKGEAAAVLAAAGVVPGMRVADVGAGEGYYTLKLAARVGPRGAVIAEDIVPDYVSALGRRIRDEALGNVRVTLGTADDAKLPPASVDRVFLIHMYHEIAQPYALLWRLRAALRPGGRIVIVDADRPTQAHGTPPRLLACELSAVGYAEVKRQPMPQASGYLAMFEARGPAPKPGEIRACTNRR